MRRPRYSAQSVELARRLAARCMANIRAGHSSGVCAGRPCAVHATDWDSTAGRADNARWYIEHEKARGGYAPRLAYDFAEEA